MKEVKISFIKQEARKISKLKEMKHCDALNLVTKNATGFFDRFDSYLFYLKNKYGVNYMEKF